MYNIDEIVDTIICGSTLDELKQFPDECIDTVCCSPPYWGLRSYSTNPQVWGGDVDCEHEWFTGKEKVIRGTPTRIENSLNQATYKDIRLPSTDTCQICNAWRGELGLEPTFQEYIQHLQLIFDEVYRVLKKTGTCWVNLGDSYAGSGKGYGGADHGKLGKHANEFLPAPIDTEIPTKSLCNIPFRFAISMTDHNWIQRNTVIWHKPSCMPSSAKDRFTVDFEYIFFFTKNKKYWFEQQFDAYTEPLNRWGGDRLKYKDETSKFKDKKGYETHVLHDQDIRPNPNGRNKRAVWRINPQPFKDAHFAVFPEKLVEPMIKAGCPIDGTVLDSFVGSGTTCLVARKLGRHYIGIDLNESYVKMAEKRLTEVL